MSNKGLRLFNPVRAIFNVLLIGAGLSVAMASEIGTQELSVDKKQSRVLIEKASVLEAGIENRQQQMALEPQGSLPSREYQSGFEDGYNKAIIDLLKSKLLNDPSLSPKPMGDGLYSGSLRRSSLQRSQPQRRYEPTQTPSAVQSSLEAGAKPVEPKPVEPLTSVLIPGPASQVSAETAPVEDSPATAPVSPVPILLPSAPAPVSAGQANEVPDTDTQETNSVLPSQPQPQETPATIDATSSAAALAGAPPVPAAPVPAPQTPAPPTAEQAAQDWLQKANGYVEEQNWQQAVQASTEALTMDGELVEAYIVRSWAYAETGQLPQAMNDITVAVNLDSANAVAYNNRGYVNELMDKPEQAQQDYQQACSLGYQQACETADKLRQARQQQQRQQIEELTQLNYQQFQLRDWKGVVKSATALLAIDPENTTALVNRAGAYTELGWFNKALDDCNTALIIDPKLGLAYNNKGYVLELMGEPKKAAMEYETACVLGIQQSCSDFKRLSQKLSSR